MLIQNTYIYEVKSIGLSTRNGRKPQTLLTAARHNLREIQAENGADFGTIDPCRMHLNEVLIGPKSAREVLSESNKLFDHAGVDKAKLRRDYNQASEHVFSLRSGQCEGGFFESMAECSQRIFGKDKVLSFVVHHDQDQPHAHMLVSPISDGKFLGSKLHDHGQLKRYKSAFQKCAETIGFKPVPERRLNRKQLGEMQAKVVSWLEYNNDPILFHPHWMTILEMIINNPVPLYQRLNLENTTVPKTMSQDRLFATDRSHRRSCGNQQQSDSVNLPSVGLQMPETQVQVELVTPNEVRPQEKGRQLTRVQESKIPSDYYDCDTGEFFQPTRLVRSGKREADSWVHTAISNLRCGHQET